MSDTIKALPGMVRAHKTAYGVNHVGKPQYGEGSWERIDVWVSDDKGDSERVRRACTGPTDDTDAAHKQYGDFGNVKYHPACPCCWLGHGHTVAYHNLHTDHGRKAWE